MAVNFYFCDVCLLRITQAELDSGRAVATEERRACAACHKAAAPTDADDENVALDGIAAPAATTVKFSNSRISSDSKTRSVPHQKENQTLAGRIQSQRRTSNPQPGNLHKNSQATDSNNILLWSAAGGVLLLILAFFIFSGPSKPKNNSNSNSSSATASNTNPPATSTETPGTETSSGSQPPVAPAVVLPVVNTDLNIPWTPAQLSTEAWFDAAEAKSVNQADGKVSQWNDKSGNSRHAAQSSANSRPQFISGSLNGLPALEFDGKDDGLTTSGSPFGVRNVIAVINMKSAAFSGWPWVFGSRGFRIPALYGEEGTKNIASQLPAQSSKTAKVYVNGVTDGTRIGKLGTASNFDIVTSISPAVSNSRNDWLIGNGDGAWNGKIAELILVSGDLSEENRQKLEGYLAHKWGLAQNLPAGHPYKTTAPTTTGTSTLANTNAATSNPLPPTPPATPLPVNTEPTREEQAEDAFDVMFAGVAPEDKEAKQAKLKEFLEKYGDTLYGSRARIMLSKLQAPTPPANPSNPSTTTDAPLINASNQGFELNASNVKLQGQQLTVNSNKGVSCINNWNDPAEYLTWNLNVTEAQKYRVKLTYALTNGRRGHNNQRAIVLSIGNATLTITINSTGGWESYKTIDAGSITLAAGQQPGTLKSQTATTQGIMNFVKLELLPESAPVGNNAPTAPGPAKSEYSAKWQASQLTGGKDFSNWRNTGVNARAIWGQGSGTSSITLPFELPEAKYGSGVLLLSSITSGGAIRLGLTLNGKDIFEGDHKPPSSEKHSDVKYPIPTGLLKNGKNDLKIELRQPGKISNAPFLMLSTIEIRAEK